MIGSERVLKIGTRGSTLARWQADHVAMAIDAQEGAPETEQVLIRTEGDRVQDVPLWKVDGKAFFTKEIEEALLDGRIDVAVHSLKDLATEMAPELTLGAVMSREDHRDVLLFRPGLLERPFPEVGGALDPADLPEGAVVGTSSLRRRAFLRRWRPSLELRELRGNVPTRIEKLDAGEYDAIVLAAAGVKRLGLSHRISAYLSEDDFLPAVSQGAIGLQVRADDSELVQWILRLEDSDTRGATAAERALLRRMEGGCQVPVGAFAQVTSGRLRLRGMVASLDGSTAVSGEAFGKLPEAENLGRRLGDQLLAEGAGHILAEIRRASTDG